MIFKIIKNVFYSLLILILMFVTSLYWPRNIDKLEGINTKLPVISKQTPAIKVHYIKTGEVTTLDAFTYSGGSIFKTKTLTHGAVLIEHPLGNVLIDSGLGENAQAQFSEDMPNYLKPMMAFKQITNTKADIVLRKLPKPDKILLTHTHWDHASALEDFAEIDVLITTQEFEYVSTHGVPDIFPSQVENKEFNWKTYNFENKAYGVFEQSYDLYNDGSIVVVPLIGHSPGSVGIFVTNQKTRRFFVGDAVWNKQAILKLKPKMWFSKYLTDSHENDVEKVIALLNIIQQQNPEILIVPAHDADAWK
ncbi:MAG: MBL fold metallo-hydrolase [Pseudomonadales bacterium]|nr:MBL fold metallo-hydrolase [Pseudomonadales bacterium]